MRWRTSNCSLLLIYRLRKDETLSWPSWLTCSGRFTHISGHPLAAGQAQNSESSPAKDRRYHCATQPTNKIRSAVYSMAAVQIHRYFDDKVADVRSATADAPPPSFTSISADAAFCHFQSVTFDEVTAAFRALGKKLRTRSSADCTPCRHRCRCWVALFNRSPWNGSVPKAFRAAYIMPLLKKSDIDPATCRLVQSCCSG